MILILGAMVPLGGNKVSIDRDRLAVAVKTVADWWAEIVERMTTMLQNIKVVARKWFESLPKSSKSIKVKSYPAAQFTKGKHLKNFILMNKPKRLCVRNNC